MDQYEVQLQETILVDVSLDKDINRTLDILKKYLYNRDSIHALQWQN